MTKKFALIGALLSLAACNLNVQEPVTTDVEKLALNEGTNPSGGALAFFAPPPTSTHIFGEPVPYGEMARICNAPRNLGTEIIKVGGFTIYDSAPGSTQLRAHYISGFDDRCVRQFSAALITTGGVDTHEKVRYLPSNKARFSATDAAYETLKGRFCRVRNGQPCGSRIDALAKRTTFITAYETFGSRPIWVDILLHDGEMKAIDFKTH